MYEDVKCGCNFYCLWIENLQGDIFYFEEVEVIFYGDLEIVLFYLNLVEEVVIFELFEIFGEFVIVELLGVQGNVIYVQQLVFDVQ